MEGILIGLTVSLIWITAFFVWFDGLPPKWKRPTIVNIAVYQGKLYGLFSDGVIREILKP